MKTQKKEFTNYKLLTAVMYYRRNPEKLDSLPLLYRRVMKELIRGEPDRSERGNTHSSSHSSRRKR